MAIDLTGQRFGALLVIKRAQNDISENGRVRAAWWCQCDCGNEVVVLTIRLRQGRRKSCGRGHRWQFQASKPKHHLTYKSWLSLRARCYRKKHHRYAQYGARGITVCERWNNYENFLNDMGERLSVDYSIDRIDVNGNYEPTNCRWATRDEQRRNMRNSIYVEYKGERVWLKDLCVRLNVKDTMVRARLKIGWPLEKALHEPVRVAREPRVVRHHPKMRGKRFGYLTVIEKAKSTSEHAWWRCKCDCGQYKIVRADHLRRGRVKACNKDHRWRGVK